MSGAPAIRTESPGDRNAVRALNEAAFDQPDEAALVDALREAGAHVPELCLVAIDGERVVGHIFYSEARVASGHTVLALAPMAVDPGRQREGIGALLVHESLERARALEHPLAIVLGHPGYYPRFGFEPAAPLGLGFPGEVPAEAWMALRLPCYTDEARGSVSYAPPFGLG